MQGEVSAMERSRRGPNMNAEDGVNALGEALNGQLREKLKELLEAKHLYQHVSIDALDVANHVQARVSVNFRTSLRSGCRTAVGI